MKLKGIVTLILGWAVPGLGHAVQKKYLRALLFFISIFAMTGIGLAMGGKVYPMYLEPPRTVFQVVLNLFKKENPLTILAFFADLGNGLFYALSRLFAWGGGQLERATFEFGTAYIAGAGLLNFLIAIDAYDIGAGKKK
jgi:Family of unknown function (DUF6677)